MKTTLPITLFSLSLGLPLGALAVDDHVGHGGHAVATPASDHMTMVDGVIKKIDKAAGRVTISHGPLPNGMPAMTMAFRLKEAKWIGQFKEGDKIRFASDLVNGAMTVVHFERVN